ncbi:MAG: response regulator [Proteobacteria bacterium]|nr:response regulator [Pseudomonadota bacterium]MBU1717390.1 response regulator [Pseudomonadota bacterium]
MTINKKLTLLFIFLTITPLLFLGYYSIDKTTGIVKNYAVEEAKAQAEIIAHTLTLRNFFTNQAASQTSFNDLQHFVQDFHHLYHRDIVVLDSQLMVVADAIPQNIGVKYPHFEHDQEKITAIMQNILSHGIKGTFREISGDGTFELVAVPVTNLSQKDIKGVVILEYSALYNASLATAHNLGKTILTGTIVLSIITILLSFFFSRQISRPIQYLSRIAKKLGAGDFSEQSEITSQDEIGELANTFNKMAENLQQLVARERESARDEAASNDRLRREIEERLKTENALRESEELYRSLVENIRLGVSLIDNNHQVIMVNKAHANLLKKNPADFVGKKCFKEFEGRDQICPHCPGVLAMQDMQVHEVDTSGIKDDGSQIRVRIKAFPTLGQDGQASGFIEVVEDITEQEKIETELHRAKHIELIGTLAGGIAHDFNNLLSGILGNITLARLYIGQEKKVIEKLDICEKAVGRAKNLSQQLLTFSRGGSPVKEISSIIDLLNDSISFALSGNNISCNYLLPPDLWAAEIDYGQMGQVFQNIVTNAIQVMPEGGFIEVTAQNIKNNAKKSIRLPQEKYVKISIKDHGPGIAPEIIDRIFDPFFTTKVKGSGLGLAICYSIINKHHGHIEVESEIGTGTVFHIYIPATDRVILPENPSAEKVQKGTGRILIMDDEELVRETAADLLCSLGYKVEMASDGLEAIDHYRKAKSAGQKYDLVILDLTVPGGMGGMKALNKLLEFDPEIRAIVSSGYANNSILANYRQHGFRGIATKPYTLQDLSKVVSEVITLTPSISS